MSGMQQLMLASGDFLQLNGASYSDSVVGGTASVTLRVDSDGGVYLSRANVAGGAFQKQYDWVLPNESAANYEVRWVTQGNDPDSTFAASGTWVACTIDRDLTTSQTNGADTSVVTLEIGRLGTSTELRSVTIDFDVDGSP